MKSDYADAIKEPGKDTGKKNFLYVSDPIKEENPYTDK